MCLKCGVVIVILVVVLCYQTIIQPDNDPFKIQDIFQKDDLTKTAAVYNIIHFNDIK